MAILKSELLYTYYQFKQKPIKFILFLFIYVAIYVFAFSQRKALVMRNNYDNILIVNFFLILIMLRLIIGAISQPYDIISKEYIDNIFVVRSTMFNHNIEKVISVKILLQFIKTIFLNVFMVMILVVSLNLYSNFINYVYLFIPVFTGTVFLGVIGYLLSFFGMKYDIKRETISFIQIVILLVLLQIKKTAFWNPYSVIRSGIYGILSGDLIFFDYYKFKTSYLIYYGGILVVSMLVSYGILCFMSYNLRKVKYK